MKITEYEIEGFYDVTARVIRVKDSTGIMVGHIMENGTSNERILVESVINNALMIERGIEIARTGSKREFEIYGVRE